MAISETSEFLGLSRTESKEITQNGVRKKQITSSEPQFCRPERLADERGRRKVTRLVQANRKAATSLGKTLYTHGEQKSTTEHNAH